MLLKRMFASSDVEDVRGAVTVAFGAAPRDLSDRLDAALRGDARSVRMYVLQYGAFAESVLHAADEHANLIVVGEAHLGRLPRGRPDSHHYGFWALLLNTSAEAPFSPWTAKYGADGIALELVSRTRRYMPGSEPLVEPTTKPRFDPSDVDVPLFVRSVRRVIDRLDAPSPLEDVMRAFDLDQRSTADLFGVKRQAIARWLSEGRVPRDRQEKLAALASLADLLERKLKPRRLPGIARRPADAYGGLSMLEMVSADRHDELLRSVRRSFEWERAA